MLRDDAESAAGPVSRLVFHWIAPLIAAGRRAPLQGRDLPPIHPADSAAAVAPVFGSVYRVLRARDLAKGGVRVRPAPELLVNEGPAAIPGQACLLAWVSRLPERMASVTSRAVLVVAGRPYWICVLWKPVWLCAAIAQVFAIRALVERVGAGEGGRSRWLFLPVAVALAISAQIMSLSQHACFYGSMRAGMRARAALSSAVYRKTLRLSAASLAVMSEGEVGNLLLNDTQRLLDSFSYLHFSWFGFVEIAVVSSLLWIDLGVSALFGVFILLLLVPGQLMFSVLVSRARSRVMAEADVRVQTMNEILAGIRIVKLSAWEPYFIATIERLRRREIRHLRTGAILRALNTALFFSAPIFVALSSFTAYTLVFNKRLTPAVAFSSLGFFTVLSRVLSIMPHGWLAMSEAIVSARRFDKFFNLDELDTIPDSDRLDVAAFAVNDNDDGEDCQRAEENVNMDNDLGQLQSPPLDPTMRAVAKSAEFSWTQLQDGRISDFATVLSDVDLCVQDGQFVCVVGPVGSGKSSLLLGLLGEMHCTSGSAGLYGRVAYCAQQPWIVNGTVRDNITMFGETIDADEEKYARVLEACCLRPDLRTLPAGDLTEIGERGINLSGGQKARLALARAAFADADVYLLDDPLSAVDARVAARLVRRVFGPKGLLANKARIMVTHQLHVLPISSVVLVLAGGRIAHKGTFQELHAQGVRFSGFAGSAERDSSADCGDPVWGDDEEEELESKGERHERRLREILRDSKVSPSVFNISGDNEEDTLKLKKSSTEDGGCTGVENDLFDENEDYADGENGPEGKNHVKRVDDGALVVDEDRRVGRVTGGVYMGYIRAGGGVVALIAVLCAFAAAQGVRQSAEWWMAQWSTDGQARLPSSGDDLTAGNRFYALVFLGLALGTTFLTLVRASVYAGRTMVASRRLHDDLLHSVLHAKSSFFDTNPIGRILNRFSKDIDQMDIMLPQTSQDFLQVAFVVMGALAIICWILPWFLLPLVPIIGIFLYLQHMYKMSSRELKRLDGMSRSPIAAQLVETLVGMSTVRAYAAEETFSAYFDGRVDTNHRAYHMFVCAGRWLGVRLDSLSSLVVLATSCVVLVVSPKLNPGLAGVALTQSVLTTGLFQWGIRQAAETENLFTSVERVSDMATQTPLEAPHIVEKHRPPEDWPSEGVVVFEKVVLRYRPELEPALRNLSFRTHPRERIGIVGRTGSGKSSMFVALFRMVELSGGRITIDGLDIAQIGLHDLRSRLAIVPQDPVLFNGTIRSNLDPVEAHSDIELWDVLRRVHMSEAIANNDSYDRDLSAHELRGQGLDMAVYEKGCNFSAGERQLLSLGRAILSGVRVVVLDEASASLDNHTDMLIQRTVREQMSGCTVLTIAHRLATIADSDRVLVIDDGEAVEFGTPDALLSSGGYFSRLVEETGPIESAILKAIIAESTGVSSL